MSAHEQLRAILREVLRIDERVTPLVPATPLLGALPELDSFAVVSIMNAVEERFGVTIHDDEVSAEQFATFGALAEFVDQKLAQ